MAGTLLPFCLVFAATQWGGLAQAPGPAAHPGPPVLRLQRLEKQVHRLQEVTLSHLQSIAKNYNISYNIDQRFQALAEQAEVAAAAQAALGAELARLAATGRRLHRRLKQLEGTVGALSRLHCPLPHPQCASGEAGTELHGLPDAVQSRGSQLEQPWGQGGLNSPNPQHPKARQQLQWEEEQRLPADARLGEAPGEDVEPPCEAAPGAQAALGDPTMTTAPQEQPPDPQPPEEGRSRPPTLVPTSPACHTGAILLFPNTSGEHVAILGPGPRQELRALSVCAWLATPAPSLGALISYTTADGSSKLAVHSHSEDQLGSARFSMGDGEFRELPVMWLLDGQWHHLCLIWSSAQGQYRFYVDRRLLAAGSGFRQGYEIPAGGSLVLGREQDRAGGALGSTEAFVGHLAGLALWSRALLPGEVAGMATGQGLPRGPLLTLSAASLQGGAQRVACPRLRQCPGGARRPGLVPQRSGQPELRPPVAGPGQRERLRPGPAGFWGEGILAGRVRRQRDQPCGPPQRPTAPSSPLNCSR